MLTTIGYIHDSSLRGKAQPFHISYRLLAASWVTPYGATFDIGVVIGDSLRHSRYVFCEAISELRLITRVDTNTKNVHPSM